MGWAPSPSRIRVTNPSGAPTPTVSITLSGRSVPGGGEVMFASSFATPPAPSLTLTVPTNGASVPFLVAGQFGKPSIRNGDVTIEGRFGGTVVGTVAVMVRIRKNANLLTAEERDRFIAAFAQLNNPDAGRFTDFREMHTEVSSRQAHGAAGFLPWHRAYLIDVERELQAIDASVALPVPAFRSAGSASVHARVPG